MTKTTATQEEEEEEEEEEEKVATAAAAGTTTTTTIKGVIFRRTIRASYASLDLVHFKQEECKEEHIVAILQCPTKFHTESVSSNCNINGSDVDGTNNVSSWRSNIRRICKLGTEIELAGVWSSSSETSHSNSNNNNSDKSWSKSYNAKEKEEKDPQTLNNNDKNKCHAKRFRVSESLSSSSTTTTNKSMRVLQMQKWDMIRCQATREKYYPGFEQDCKSKTKETTSNVATSKTNGALSLSQKKQRKYEGQTGHGGGLGKRKQGEIIAELLIDIVAGILDGWNENDYIDKDNNSLSVESVKSRFVNLTDIQNHLSKHKHRTSETSNNHENENNEDDYDRELRRSKVIEFLNQGSGVMDVAGGSGHLSLALGLRGIKSTVIDPRETVGKLPGRDRKALRKALKNKGKTQNESNDNHGTGDKYKSNKSRQVHNRIIPPPSPIEFSAMRAWFSKRPDGIDTEFREGTKPSSTVDKVTGTNLEHDGNSNTNTCHEIPVCSVCSPDGLISSCSAIVALHPDEATGEIVEVAVKHKKLFVAVPCCVFSRLFPHRFKPQPQKTIQSEETQSDHKNAILQKREIVSTYDDLIEYLVDKDKSIKVTRLNFEGANLALWSTFIER